MLKVQPFDARDVPAAPRRPVAEAARSVPPAVAVSPVAVPPVAAPGPAPFTFRIALGLIGILTAVLVAGFNDHVIDVELPDIRGAMGIGHDHGTWLTALYEAFEVSAMAFAPWCAVTFSIRRFAIAMMGLFAVLAAIAPFVTDLPNLYLLRAVQGFAGGCMPPLLMTVALRYLPTNIKIYGLGAYALTATFGPNIGTPLAAFAFDDFGWRAAFWEVIPFSLISMACVAYGLPQDPLRLERFRQFDWRGLLLGLSAICMLVVALMQGDRLDWFRSPVICQLFVGGVFLFGLFLLNEWFHPLPFFRIQMLRSRDISFALVAVAVVLVMAAVNMAIPSLYLADVQLYRPEQMVPLALVLAVPQLVALPLVSALCNIRRVDCRWVFAIGLVLMGISFFGGTHLTSDWFRGNFYPLELLQVFAQPMTVIPILMLATMKLAPTDGPFVSGMFNMVKGLAAAIATGIVDAMMTWREHTHSNILLDQYGASRFVLNGFHYDYGGPDGGLAAFASAVRDQAVVLASADIYLAMIGLAAALLLLLLVLPTRVYPPASVGTPAPGASAPRGR
jgi:MFS transporter, DHA2 family, multidrug resistance protein